MINVAVKRRELMTGLLTIALSSVYRAQRASSVPDDGPMLQQLLDTARSGAVIKLSPREYTIGQELVFKSNNITLDLNGATLHAMSGRQFEFVLKAVGRSGLIVSNGTIDANGAGRASGQTIRFMGGGFIDSTECVFDAITVKNTLGFGAEPAVGLTIGGRSKRCQFNGCTAVDCGTLIKPSDGFFMSGDGCLGQNCIATNCYDTGFVVESSNYSGYSRCMATRCSAGAAVTNASGLPARGNFLRQVTVIDWNSPVTGGIQIGVPTKTDGNLIDSQIDVSMSAPSKGRGIGPAINVRQLGRGKAVGVRITGQIDGASAQGVLIQGDDVVISMAITGVRAAAVQFDGASIGGRVVRSTIRGGRVGVAATGDVKALVQQSELSGQSEYNAYAYDDSCITVSDTKLGIAGIAHVGKARGKTCTKAR